MPEDHVLAVDIGGTKLAVAVVDAEGGIRHRLSAPTSKDCNPEVPFGSLARLISDVLGAADTQVGAIGVGSAGPMNWPEGRISPLNIPGWRNFPMRQRLAEHFGLPVRLHNDAVCMALGEYRFGHGQGHRDFLGLVVSTGVGGGVISGGRLLDGRTGNAGHIGHVVADPAGPPCRCGGRGCVEAMARGPAIVAWAQEQGWQPNGSADGRTLAAAARQGDEIALEAFSRSGRAVGIGIASAATLLDLSHVAVGGGLANAGDLLFDPMRAAVAEHARMSFVSDLQIVAADPDAGLRGAAALIVDDRFWNPAQVEDASE